MLELEAASVVPHLVRRGLITAAECARTRPAVDRLGGRNLLYRVAFDPGSTFLFKQAVDSDTRGSVGRESSIYDHLAGGADGDRRAEAFRFVRKLDFDPAASVLVLEFLEGYRPLAAALEGRGDTAPDAEMAAGLGKALRELSSIPAPPLDTSTPWILSLVHPPVGILREATPAILDLARTVQRSATWRRCLERLTLEWDSSSIVHGDLRFSNILLPAGGGATDRSEPAIVDWELAGPGNPLWDAGWAMAGFLARSPGRTAAAFPLLRAFWTAYGEGRPESERSTRLEAALSWTAAALLQMAYEAARAHPPLVRRIDRLLEIGRSLLERSPVWVESVFLASGEAGWQEAG